MSLPAPVKAVALLVFLAAIGGATYGVQHVLGDNLEDHLLGVTATRSTLNGTAGHDVTYALTVHNRGDAARDVRLAVEGDVARGESSAFTVPAGGNATVFVTVPVADDAAPGDHPLGITLLPDQGDERLRVLPDALRLRVLGEGRGFQEGDSASVVYVGRLADSGRVFNTNDNRLTPLAFPKAEGYRPSPGLLDVQSVPRPTVVQGFYEGMQGMQAGESRTFTFGPEKGYGNATIEESEPRNEVLQRRFELELTVESVGREVFDQYIAESGQGDPAAFGSGDIFVFTQGQNAWPYRVVDKTDEEVMYTLAVEAGQTYTLYPFWTNASRVESVNDTHAVFLTTPTTPTGQNFTMRGYWPDMSVILTVNETNIEVRHSPPVGYTYNVPGGQFAPPTQYTVKELTDDRIVAVTPSTNPLAGKSLTFDVLLVELKQG